MHETELLNATKTAIFLFQMTFHNIIFILYLHIQVPIIHHQYKASSDTCTYNQTSAEAEASSKWPRNWFKDLDVLRKAWKNAQQAVTNFKIKCQNDMKNWPGNYEKGASPLMDAARQPYVEYDTLKRHRVKKCVIFSCPTLFVC